MATRFTALFAVTTAPTNRGAAQPHSGGWSEGYWIPDALSGPNQARFLALMTKRARLLPTEAAMIGYRVQTFTLLKNKMLPGAATSAKTIKAGNPAYTVDVPQAAFSLTLGHEPDVNKTRLILRCIPDEQIQNGEYTPTDAYKEAMRQFTQGEAGGLGRSITSICRKLSNPASRVVSYSANILTLSDAGIAVEGDYLRLSRVYDQYGRSVTGSYQVGNVVGKVYTLVNGPVGFTVLGSGTARKDELVELLVDTVSYGRATVKKIGRPFELYRGRQSNRA